jgi:hypothetical protein
MWQQTHSNNANGDDATSVENVHAMSGEKMKKQGVPSSLLHASNRLDAALGI